MGSARSGGGGGGEKRGTDEFRIIIMCTGRMMTTTVCVRARGDVHIIMDIFIPTLCDRRRRRYSDVASLHIIYGREGGGDRRGRITHIRAYQDVGCDGSSTTSEQSRTEKKRTNLNIVFFSLYFFKLLRAHYTNNRIFF